MCIYIYLEKKITFSNKKSIKNYDFLEKYRFLEVVT